MLSLCAVLIIAACAGTTVQRVPDSKNAEIDGIRYYQSAPFLLVFSNGKGNITSQLVYLPDTTRMMALDPYAFAASNDSTFKFTNGLLQEATTVVDETLVPKAIVTALGTAASTAFAAFNTPVDAGVPLEAPPPMLFRIVQLSNGTWALVGGPGLGPDGKSIAVKITKTEEPKAPASPAHPQD